MPKATEVIYQSYDLTHPGIDAVIGQALMTELADAVPGQIFTFTVTAYELNNPAA